jgi:hypothetical protein
MKIAQIILEADVDAATQKLNQEYEQKLKQLPNVLKGIKGDVTKAMAQLKARDPQAYAKEAPALITDTVNRVVDFKDPKNNEPPFTGNPDDAKALDAYITGAIKAKYQETIYKTVNRGDKGAGTAANAAAGAQPKPNEPTSAGVATAGPAVDPKVGDTVTYTNAKGENKQAVVNQLLTTKDAQGDEQIQLKAGSAIFAVDKKAVQSIDKAAPAGASAEPAAQAPGAAIPADVQKQLDALTPQERDELLKALAA